MKIIASLLRKIWFIIILALFNSILITVNAQSKKVIIDCDPGDDDALELILAMQSPQIEIVGITTVSGNAYLDQCTKNALRVVELSGKNIPVYKGAEKSLVVPQEAPPDFIHGKDGLGNTNQPEPKISVQSKSASQFVLQVGVTTHLRKFGIRPLKVAYRLWLVCSIDIMAEYSYYYSVYILLFVFRSQSKAGRGICQHRGAAFENLKSPHKACMSNFIIKCLFRRHIRLFQRFGTLVCLTAVKITQMCDCIFTYKRVDCIYVTARILKTALQKVGVTSPY